MAPKKAASKKRARSKSRPRPVAAAAATAISADISRDVSPRDLKKIKRAIAKVNLEDVASIQDVLRTKLELNYIAENDILRCIASKDEDNGDDDDDIKMQNLQALVIRAWVQKQKADLVFEMLDEAGKGVVVVEDLQLVAAEYLSEDIKDESDLVEMIQEVDQSGDGILTKDDFYRIASQILL